MVVKLGTKLVKIALKTQGIDADQVERVVKVVVPQIIEAKKKQIEINLEFVKKLTKDAVKAAANK